MRGLSRPERFALLGAVTVLTVVPALTTLAPQSTVQVDLRLVPGVRHAPGQPAVFVKKALPGVEPLLATLPSSAANLDLYRSLSVSPEADRPDAGVRISARSSKPKVDARIFNLIAARIVIASGVSARFWLRAHDVLLPRYRHALTRPHLSSSARRAILAEELFVGAALREPPPAGPMEAEHVVTSLHGLRGEIFSHLPGNPEPPSFLWAAVAGFILGVALCGTWIYTGDRGIAS